MRGEWKALRGPLTPPERARRASLESVIERGLTSFFEVGAALYEMRASRLYRDTHRTFKEYCRERWGFSASRARQQIVGYARATALTQGGLPAPRNERVVRELARLGQMPERQQAAWRLAVEEHGAEPTAEQVRRIVEAVRTFSLDPVDTTGIRPDGGAATPEAAEQLRELWTILERIPLERIRQMHQILGWCVELQSQWGKQPVYLPLRVRRRILELVAEWTRGLEESGEIVGLVNLDGPRDWERLWRIQMETGGAD